jgi:hypothetical protein
MCAGRRRAVRTIVRPMPRPATIMIFVMAAERPERDHLGVRTDQEGGANEAQIEAALHRHDLARP